MASATLFAQPFLFITDDNNNPVDGAKIYIYEAGSSTPAVVYHDADHMSAWTQPIRTAANGKTAGPIFVTQTPSLKVDVTDADDAPIDPWPVDDWTPYTLAS